MLSSPWSQIGPWAEGMATPRSSARGEPPLLRDLLWHSFGAGGSASQVSLSCGAGDAKRGGFGLACRHGAVNSERAVVLTDCKCFSGWRWWLRTGAWWQGLILLALTPCSLLHVGGLDWEQAWCHAGRSTEQAVSVS